MSRKCPRCGLFNPAEAARCDCGYDFATKTVTSSYLLAHILSKHGEEAKLIRESSRTYIRHGALLLMVAAVVTALGFLKEGRVYILVWAVIWGAVYLSRGLRHRRLRTLDSDMKDRLMKRS